MLDLLNHYFQLAGPLGHVAVMPLAAIAAMVIASVGR